MEELFPRIVNSKESTRSAMSITNLTVPSQCLVHRILYYCLARPILTDYEYDMLERDALREVEDDPSHLLHRPGSDREATYPESLVDVAYEEAYPILRTLKIRKNE